MKIVRGIRLFEVNYIQSNKESCFGSRYRRLISLSVAISCRILRAL